MGKSKCLILAFLLILNGCDDSAYVDIYYDGFWTKHRVYQNESQLLSTAKLKVTNVELRDISAKASSHLFDNYRLLEMANIPEDIILAVIVRSPDGKVKRKIIGDAIYLFDVTKNKFKILNNNEKDFLRCYFYEISDDIKIDAKLRDHCANYVD